MLYDRSETPPPGWRVSMADDGSFVDGGGTVALEATPTWPDANRWRLACSASVEDVDELGTIRSREAALDALRSVIWHVHRNGIEAEHVGVSLERDGRDVDWRGWQFK